jgi:hypothetical protein
MFHTTTPLEPATSCDIAAVLERLAQISSRPRYAFMLLNLIAQVAGPDGSAGPWIKRDNELVSLRDWLCDALTPNGQRARVTWWPSGSIETSSADCRAMRRMQRAITEEMRARISNRGQKQSQPRRFRTRECRIPAATIRAIASTTETAAGNATPSIHWLGMRVFSARQLARRKRRSKVNSRSRDKRTCIQPAAFEQDCRQD